LRLTELKDELFDNEKLFLYLQIKTTNRVYEMYKLSMARTLFTNEELLAYYLLNSANKEGTISDRDASICLKTHISERQYYYLIRKLINQGTICHDKNGIHILDINHLKNVVVNVTEFMENKI